MDSKLSLLKEDDNKRSAEDLKDLLINQCVELMDEENV